jgi:pimeloyl-ACP methyl ester carboxylesterase
VVAPDLLGCGATAKPEAEYSVSAHANVLRDLMTALGHERATVVGHSLGGGIAMQFAYQFPERCERLVLVSSGGLGREVSALLRGLTIPGVEQLFPLVCSRRWLDAAARVAGWLDAVGMIRPAPHVEEGWRSYASLVDGDARRAFFRTLRAVIDAHGQTVCAVDRLYLAGLLPTLILWGARDTLIPVSHGVAAHGAIPGSRLEVFEDAGHFPHCESPARFADTVAGFIDATEPSARPEQAWRELVRRGAHHQPEGVLA